MAMLEKWVSIEKEGATAEELCYILEGLKMKELADKIMDENNKDANKES